jgi:hypothetical protein
VNVFLLTDYLCAAGCDSNKIFFFYIFEEFGASPCMRTEPVVNNVMHAVGTTMRAPTTLTSWLTTCVALSRVLLSPFPGADFDRNLLPL